MADLQNINGITTTMRNHLKLRHSEEYEKGSVTSQTETFERSGPSDACCFIFLWTLY
jgi:hypothetical protein